jgi:hypothetical protein
VRRLASHAIGATGATGIYGPPAARNLLTGMHRFASNTARYSFAWPMFATVSRRGAKVRLHHTLWGGPCNAGV